MSRKIPWSEKVEMQRQYTLLYLFTLHCSIPKQYLCFLPPPPPPSHSAGDVLMVQPQNISSAVDEFVDLMNLDPDQRFTLVQNDGGKESSHDQRIAWMFYDPLHVELLQCMAVYCFTMNGTWWLARACNSQPMDM